MKPFAWVIWIALSFFSLDAAATSVDLPGSWNVEDSRRTRHAGAEERKTVVALGVVFPASSYVLERPAYSGSSVYSPSSLMPGISAQAFAIRTSGAIGLIRLALGARFFLLERTAKIQRDYATETVDQSLSVLEAPIGFEWIPSFASGSLLSAGLALSAGPAFGFSARTAVAPAETLVGSAFQAETFFVLEALSFGGLAPRVGVQAAVSKFDHWAPRMSAGVGFQI